MQILLRAGIGHHQVKGAALLARAQPSGSDSALGLCRCWQKGAHLLGYVDFKSLLAASGMLLLEINVLPHTHHCTTPHLSDLAIVFLLFFSIRGILWWKVPDSACILTGLRRDSLVLLISLGRDLQWLSSGLTLLKWMELPNTQFSGFYISE